MIEALSPIHRFFFYAAINMWVRMDLLAGKLLRHYAADVASEHVNLLLNPNKDSFTVRTSICIER